MALHTPVKRERITMKSSLLKEFRFPHLLSSLTAGLVDGILTVIISISLATLIFSGTLSSHVSAGIGIVLMSAVIVSTIVSLKSSIPGTIAVPQESAAAILALVATYVTRTMSASASPEEIYLTVVATIVLSSLLTGLFFLILGRFKLGNLIRFVPYPVIGGFLAGTGWLLIQGSFMVMADAPLSFSQLSYLFQAPALIRWLPGMIFAVLLLLLVRRYTHFLVMPVTLSVTGIVFYVVLALTNTPVSEAAAQGWLLAPPHAGVLWQPLSVTELTHVNWLVIFEHIGSLTMILVVSAISILLNASALALVIERDIDLNRELEVAGIANLVSAFGGGMVGYQSLSDSVLAHKMGAQTRLVGLFVALLCALTLCLGASILSFFPKPLLGGLLFFLGLDFLVHWVYDSWFKLPRGDYAIVLLILVVVSMFGFLEGIGVGIIAGIVLFIINYSRINIIKHELSGTTYRAHVDRSPEQRRVLNENGNQLSILKLQGFVFFGTADNLLEHVRQRIAQADLPPLRFVVFDFHQVSGLDSSAVFSFVRMRQLAETHKVILVFTHLLEKIRHLIEKGGFEERENAPFRIFSDLDHGIEWCENQILIAHNVRVAERRHSLHRQLEKVFSQPAHVVRLMDYLEKMDIETGYYLMRQGDRPKDLFFIESGQVTVHLELEDGTTLRLRTMGAGTVVGEMGLYLGYARSASVVADQPSTVYRLSAEALQQIEKKDPEIATTFHHFIARLLAERLVETNTTLRALLD